MRLATRIQQNQNRCSVIQRGRAAMKMSRRPMLGPLMAAAFALSSSTQPGTSPPPPAPATKAVRAVTSVAFDSRSEILITWDNLFRDKSAGLTRLSELTAAILPTVYPPPHPGEWQRSGQLAPTDINFKYWIPTAEGIELHF